MDFRRINNLPPYVFAEVNQLKLEARRAGEDIVDLGFGNPDIPSPDFVVDKLAEAAAAGAEALKRADAEKKNLEAQLKKMPVGELVIMGYVIPMFVLWLMVFKPF